MGKQRFIPVNAGKPRYTSFKELYELCCNDQQKPKLWRALVKDPNLTLAELGLKLHKLCLDCFIEESKDLLKIKMTEWFIMKKVLWGHWSGYFHQLYQDLGISWATIQQIPAFLKAGGELPPCPWDDCPPV